ncbi:MAG: type II toxin-antitoxin system RelE/ParE family toxin [Planctomycetes bacterium]|nr:type II toxin-antitoxin system RelE/ParE family toxin [Planctomycetota bacterium]
MIISFVHKGLERFFKTGDTRGIQAKHAQRLSKILFYLNHAQTHNEINQPGYDLHQLHPKNAALYAMKVSGNWRVTFRFINGNAEIVDYLDYH